MIITITLGLIIGLIMALTGAGGGILAVPLLVFGTHLSVAEAAPIGLLAVGVAAGIGAALGLKAGIVRYKAAMLMACTGMLISPLGVSLATRVDKRWLEFLFALVLIFVAYRTMHEARKKNSHREEQPKRVPHCLHSKVSGRFIWTLQCARALSFAGAIAGFFSGLLGVGGGFVLVPALKRFSLLDTQSIIATSLAVITLVSFSAIAFSITSGHLNIDIALPFAFGALIGMISGRRIAPRLNATSLSSAFALATIIVAIGMAVKSLS